VAARKTDLNIALDLLIWSGAIGCGIMAGVYFAFSTFVMQSLAAIPPETGMSAMQSINRLIIRSAFLPLFFVTTLLALAAAVIAVSHWTEAASLPLLAAGLVYVFGMFVSTLVLNIPLNDELAAADPSTHEGHAVWRRYVRSWTARNHIRTVASTLACGLFIAALLER